MLTLFNTDDGVRVVALALMAGRPVGHTDHEDQRNAENNGQQYADMLTGRPIVFDEVMQFRLLKPHSTIGSGMSFGGVIVSGMGGFGVRGHGSRLSTRSPPFCE